MPRQSEAARRAAQWSRRGRAAPRRGVSGAAGSGVPKRLLGAVEVVRGGFGFGAGLFGVAAGAAQPVPRTGGRPLERLELLGRLAQPSSCGIDRMAALL